MTDGSSNKRSWNEKLGECDFTLAFILLLNTQTLDDQHSHLSLRCLPDPSSFIRSVQNFTSWLIWGRSGDDLISCSSHSTELSLLLLRHGQCDAVEVCCHISDDSSLTSVSWHLLFQDKYINHAFVVFEASSHFSGRSFTQGKNI